MPLELDDRVDIVAVHGFNGHPQNSWTSRATRLNWLNTLLPPDIPCARIMTYGYDSGQGLRNIAMNLITDLSATRNDNVEVCFCLVMIRILDLISDYYMRARCGDQSYSLLIT